MPRLPFFPHVFITGVWLSRALARREATYGPPEEPVCPAAEHHPGQPHGCVCHPMLSACPANCFQYVRRHSLALAGVSRLMDLLADSREVIRNDVSTSRIFFFFFIQYHFVSFIPFRTKWTHFPHPSAGLVVAPAADQRQRCHPEDCGLWERLWAPPGYYNRRGQQRWR